MLIFQGGVPPVFQPVETTFNIRMQSGRWSPKASNKAPKADWQSLSCGKSWAKTSLQKTTPPEVEQLAPEKYG